MGLNSNKSSHRFWASYTCPANEFNHYKLNETVARIRPKSIKLLDNAQRKNLAFSRSKRSSVLLCYRGLVNGK